MLFTVFRMISKDLSYVPSKKLSRRKCILKSMKIYSNEEISVVWCPEKCIHARECVKGLPVVFNRDRSPWIDMSKASSEEIIEVVSRCPSGALTCKDKSDRLIESNESDKSIKSNKSDNARNEDDMMASEGSEKPQIKLMKNGPLLVEGGAALLDSAGNVLANEGTYALCRCGGSKKKPFCDGTHSKIGFDDTK
jgi:uncharacterized Fe-S cluster protein YjdI